ncbi:hypothetical protein AB0J72_34335 [Dactylosporangium sp. NPDC049742]|uniref:hypothetical protein n=1 Tax=Dactylosporangium sp. NPDC049742 TaxID=3154737 RepID=UPI003434A3C2
MCHADLTVDAWLALSDDAASRTANAIARDVDAELLSVTTHTYERRPGRVALFERDGIRYALVPGGTVQLGYDADRFVPTLRQLDDFAVAVDLYSVPGRSIGFWPRRCRRRAGRRCPPGWSLSVRSTPTHC